MSCRSTLLATAMSTLPLGAWADETPTLPPVSVTAPLPVDETAIRKPASGDAARLLETEPAVSLNGAGGISSLPALRGLADDRVKIRVDGLELTSACANHMNAPLSYVAPLSVARIDVLAGLVPVSAGGDSIAGTLEVQSRAPIYAAPGEGQRQEGQLDLALRSNGRGFGAGASASVASENFSLGLEGSIDHAESYRDGHGDKVLDTLYRTTRQALTAAARADGQEVILRLTRQTVPYQGFPNQYMDMTRNDALGASLGYTGAFAWGRLAARLYWQHTAHEMGFFSDEKTGMMPMDTSGRDAGYTLQAELPVAPGHTLRVGQEFHHTALDDRWPPVAGSMMMGPDTYINVNDGRRSRLALYGEWDARWDARWSTQIGLRGEKVRSDTGNVRAYNPMGGMMNPDAAAATAFNTQDHSRSDDNLDLTAVARYAPTNAARYEFGYARQTRSPNLYERYSWGRGTMATMMIGWYGDANGYVGNPDLKPEVAHKLAASAAWGRPESGEFKLSPHLTYVEHFIDADVIGSFQPFNRPGETRAKLQFANHDARLYGVEAEWRLPVWQGATSDTTFTGNLSWLRGRRTDGGDLYHIMPPRALLALEHTQAAWRHLLEWELVAGKRRVDEQRHEPTTGGYGLVHFSSQYHWSPKVRLTLAARNLFDKDYDLPLGGVNIAAYKSSVTSGLESVAGSGRAVSAGITLKF